jgi:Effector-associated domain 11
MNKDHFKQLIANGKTSQVFEDLSQFLKDNPILKSTKHISDLFDELTATAHRYKSLQTENQGGFVTTQDYFVETNKINRDILAHINALPASVFDPNAPVLPGQITWDTINGVFQTLHNNKQFNPHLQKYTYTLDYGASHQIYKYLQQIEINSSVDKKEIEHIVFKLLGFDDYNITLTVSEMLAGLVVQSNQYNWLLAKAMQSTRWNEVLAGIRAYSKLAEIEESMVDISELIKIALKLDAKPILSQEEGTASGHLTRAIGKINRSMGGQSVIQLLSSKGVVAKEIAIQSILFDFAENGPIFLTDILTELPQRPVVSTPPSQEQIQILQQLSQVQQAQIQQAANSALTQLNQKWNLGIVAQDTPIISKTLRQEEVNFTRRGPFSGFLVRANPDNQYELSKTLPQSAVVLIETKNTLEFLFHHASGIIIDDGASLSHRCVRLMSSGVPFCSIDYSKLADLANGSFISVNDTYFEY